MRMLILLFAVAGCATTREVPASVGTTRVEITEPSLPTFDSERPRSPCKRAP
jgi:hypothetical protein